MNADDISIIANLPDRDYKPSMRPPNAHPVDGITPPCFDEVREVLDVRVSEHQMRKLDDSGPGYSQRLRAPGEHHVEGGRPGEVTGVVAIGANEPGRKPPSVITREPGEAP
jgi:hypothetical protein